MRHRVRGRKLGRNASHRKAMFRNMAASLIKSIDVDENAKNKPRVPGRIVTTLPKAKELRPFIEKLITMARKAIPHEDRARQLETSAERNSAEWKSWRESDQWNEWNQAIAPAVALRRRVFAILRDSAAVEILFDDLAQQFEDRPGGYTRVVRLAKVRLGDAGQQALIEFVGERDRVTTKRRAPLVTEPDVPEETAAEEEAADEPENATAAAGDETAEAEAPEAEASDESEGKEEQSEE